MKEIWYAPSVNILGISTGNFIEFYWNGKLEESFLPTLVEDGVWIYIGEFGYE